MKKYALYTTNQERNRRGRPLVTYVKLIKSVTGMDNHALIQLTKNREERWRKNWYTNSRVGKGKVR